MGIVKREKGNVKRGRWSLARGSWLTSSFSEPLLAGHARLPKQPGEESHTDVTLVRVGQDHGEIAAPHLRMPPPGIWSVEPQLSEPPHQISPRDRDQLGHDARSCRLCYLIEIDPRHHRDRQAQPEA